jgi:hypothetical protein
MLSELRQALYDAIAESNDVHRTWRQLHEEGYSLYILLDCRQDDDDEDDETPRADSTNQSLALPGDVSAVRRREPEPSFRIHGGDLDFLRSIGIDPTRRIRRRRSPRD